MYIQKNWNIYREVNLTTLDKSELIKIIKDIGEVWYSTITRTDWTYIQPQTIKTPRYNTPLINC